MAKDYEIEALAVDLKSFAQHMIGVQVVGEFWDQLDDWKGYFLKLVDAQEQATKAHVDLLNGELTRIAKEEAERAQAAFGLGMMALSLVTGPLISFVAGKIEHVWFPRYASTVKERWQNWNFTFQHQSGPAIMHRGVYEHNHVHAKVFGDLGGQVVGLGINAAIKVAVPDVKAAEPSIAMARSSETMGSFKTNLELAFVAQAKATRGVILNLAGSIANNPNWGFECLEKLSQKYKGHVNQVRSEKATLQNLAYQMIREDIDRIRQQWANDWFFYGRTPPVLSIPQLREALELEQWALWILNEDLAVDVVRKRLGGGEGGGFGSRTKTHYYGKTFGDRPLPEAVLQKLAGFGALEARTMTQLIANARREAEKQTKRAAQLPSSPLGEWRQIKEWAKEDQEEKKERPLIDVGDKIDTEQEMDALEAWAKNHPPQLSNGQLVATKRVLQPIDVIVRSGKYRL